MRKADVMPVTLFIKEQRHLPNELHLPVSQFASDPIIIALQVFHIRINIYSMPDIKLTVSFQAHDSCVFQQIQAFCLFCAALKNIPKNTDRSGFCSPICSRTAFNAFRLPCISENTAIFIYAISRFVSDCGRAPAATRLYRIGKRISI